MDLGKIVGIEQLSETTPGISHRLWLHWLALDLDGFRSRCCVKIKRRVFVDVDAVQAWVEEHRCPSRNPLEEGETVETT